MASKKAYHKFQVPLPTFERVAEAFRNADGTSPNLIEKLTHSTTGITIITLTAFHEWSDVAKPVSPDKLGGFSLNEE